MKKILFPTDLSDVSVKGGAYAVAIAEKLKADFHLYHVTIQDAGQVEKKVKEVFDQLTRSVAGIKATYKVDSGFPVATITEEIKSFNADLVAMATRGEDRDELNGIHLGSSAVAVMEKANCPVLIIPPDSTYHDIKKMVLALDIDKYFEASVKQSVYLASQFNAKLFIVYVASSKSKVDDFAKVKDKLAKEISYNNVEFLVKEGAHFLESIQELVNEEKADILVMTTYKRNALTRFFDKSKTKKMAYVSEVPVLVLKG